MSQSDLALLAHLLRRAGFGATREELRRYAIQGYEATVEELLHPNDAIPALDDEDLIRRYHVEDNSFNTYPSAPSYWVYRMINTRYPLEEKLALFWHHVFATGYPKCDQPKRMVMQLDMFRRHGFGSFRDLLVELSKDPAMIVWLDNQENHRDAINENYGRELLELFSMGVGNYTEDDVRQASRAFTGWGTRHRALQTIRAGENLIEPFGRLDWQFEYESEEHDDGMKTFLGETGRFNGDDVIDIICKQPATARFLARHLYNFFVEDEVQVPAWEAVPPKNSEAIETLADTYLSNHYEIRAVMRVLLNSEFFKKAAFAKLKSPAELVAGTARMAGTFRRPSVNDLELANATNRMGQDLLNPPSVEGWHTGSEWITTASLVQRINFATHQFTDLDTPGIQMMVEHIRDLGNPQTPKQVVDSCLELMGLLSFSLNVRQELIDFANLDGDMTFGSPDEDQRSAERISSILQLIVSAREYQWS